MKKKLAIWALGAMVAFLQLMAFAETPADAGNKTRMSYPGKKWALQMELPNLEITDSKFMEDGQSRTIAGACKLEDDGKINMSIFMEKAKGKGDSKACRDFYSKRMENSPFKPEEGSVKQSEKGNLALREYLIGAPLNQKHLNIFIANDDVWIDIHLSRVLWEESFQADFDKIIDSVKIEKLADKDVMKYTSNFNAQYQKALGFYLKKQWKDAEKGLLEMQKTAQNISLIPIWLGNVYYYQKNLPDAIKYYEQTLSLEYGNRFVPDNQMRATIDNLGMAYGMSGNLKKSEATLQAGVKRYPFYPHFYYNLACTYAEGKNSDKALEYLELAFQKAESYKEEKLASALGDSSFKDLKEDARFMELLKKYNRESE